MGADAYPHDRRAEDARSGRRPDERDRPRRSLVHERYDGRGYPDGIAGRRSIEARIVFCCDAFSAMTTDRPYREAMSEWEAIGELRVNSGTQFDPAVVDALVRGADRRNWTNLVGAKAAARPFRLGSGTRSLPFPQERPAGESPRSPSLLRRLALLAIPAGASARNSQGSQGEQPAPPWMRSPACSPRRPRNRAMRRFWSSRSHSPATCSATFSHPTAASRGPRAMAGSSTEVQR